MTGHSGGINTLLETIAKRFEDNDTIDLWKSDAAALVRSYKNETTATPAVGDVLDEIIQATKRHSLDVGFTHSAPTTKELQARLDAVERIATSAINDV